MNLFIKENKKDKMLNGLDNEYEIINSDEDLKRWIEFEKPYECFGEEDKEKITSIGTSLNNCIRRDFNMEHDEAFNRFKNLIKSKKLKKPLVVYRGQESIKYENILAKKK